MAKNILKFLQICLKNLSNLFTRKIISKKKQSKTHSTYWPRLDTEIHGWINWSWSGNDIVNFIKAFGDPYVGAHTLLNNEKIYLKNCKFKNTKISSISIRNYYK